MKVDRERRLSTGMDDYVSRPIRAAVVRKMMDKRVDTTTPRQAAPNPPPPVPEPQESAGLANPVAMDIEKSLLQLDGDRELLLEALGVFLESIPGLLEDVQLAAATSDAKRLEAKAHSLKGAASMICAEPVRGVAEQLEKMGQSGELVDADVVVDDLRHRLDQLQEFADSLDKR